MTRALNGLLYNAGPIDKPEATVDWLTEFCDRHRIDFVLLCEVRRATARALHRMRGWKLIRYNDKAGQGNVAILVRDHIEVEYTWPVRMTWLGWFGHKANKWHDPRWGVTALLEGWLRATAVHAPPGVSSTRRGLLRGKPDRVAAFLQQTRNEIRFARRLNAGGAWVMGGDRNFKPRDKTVGGPVWAAERVGARVAHDQTIDWVTYSECEVMYVNARPDDGPSDHRPVTFRVVSLSD